MKKLNLIFIGLFIFSNNIFAQNVGKNNEKYWYYRERLKWFMLGVGPNAGQSMPAASRDGYNASIFPRTDPDNTLPVVDYYHDPNGKLVINLATNDTAKNLLVLVWSRATSRANEDASGYAFATPSTTQFYYLLNKHP
jgi:hypothetical protein